MAPYIEKLRVPVRLALIGCEPVPGCLTLAPRAELHDGPETILERLNEPTRVVPFHRTPDGAMLLVVRSQIAWVLADPEVAPEYIRRPNFQHTREEAARVRLVGGGRREGVLAIEMPTEFNRVSDFLNGDDDFFPLQTAEGTLLLNKTCVLEVRVRTAGELPRAA